MTASLAWYSLSSHRACQSKVPTLGLKVKPKAGYPKKNRPAMGPKNVWAFLGFQHGIGAVLLPGNFDPVLLGSNFSVRVPMQTAW